MTWPELRVSLSAENRLVDTSHKLICSISVGWRLPDKNGVTIAAGKRIEMEHKNEIHSGPQVYISPAVSWDCPTKNICEIFYIMHSHCAFHGFQNVLLLFDESSLSLELKSLNRGEWSRECSNVDNNNCYATCV